ncbi:Endonuclease/exonuclease/phosphatase [Gongronella butleri]|nr:Endonuclease/exonuclease/phosphatase [Gongronella butleri]
MSQDAPTQDHASEVDESQSAGHGSTGFALAGDDLEQQQPLLGHGQDNGDDNDDDGDEHERTHRIQASATPSMMSRSASTESFVSTQSAPPPYELYPPARTWTGRIYNWVRQLPRFATHQAIYLPTMGSRRRRRRRHAHTQHSQGEQAPYNHQPLPSTATSSLSSTSIDSIASNAYSYYQQWVTRVQALPKYPLPSSVARYRPLLVCLCILALLLCSFLLFCAIFFAPMDLPPPVIPDQVLVPGSAARILTQNIIMRPPGIKNNWSDYKDQRIDYLIEHIFPHYDIICLQEAFAFATRRKDKLIKEARLRYGFNYHVESPRKYPWNIGIDGGLLILSKYPILQADVIQYPRGKHSDWLSLKGALHAKIQVSSSSSFHLYTTHTQASYDLNNVINPDDTRIRLSQFAQLHEFISATARADDAPIMVLGDLNVDAAVHHADLPPTHHSKESSVHYTWMTQVLKGVGVPAREVGGDEDDSDIIYQHDWRLLDLVDKVYAEYGYHPVTFGDIDILQDPTRLVPGETILTDHDQLMTMQSIDRLYWSARNTTALTVMHAVVEPNKVRDNKDLSDNDRAAIDFTQISDHYGLKCQLALS